MRKKCASCRKTFEAKRPNAKYCSDRCRQRAHRKPGGSAAKVVGLPSSLSVDDPSKDGPLTRSTRARLAEMGREQSDMGVAALMAAARLDRVGGVETGAGFAALLREYRATLAEAVKNAEPDDDALAQIQESAALKLIRGGRRA